jgi:glycosyltransferase involved in cell wall biosynthesis
LRASSAGATRTTWCCGSSRGPRTIPSRPRPKSRRGLDWSVSPGLVRNTHRCRPVSQVDDLVSIIIPTCASRGLIKTCIDSLRNIGTYKNIEIVCIENIADEASEWKQWLRDNCDGAVEIQEAFNWSLFNNVAAKEASGAYLLFLNDDIEIVQPDWLEALFDRARRPEVGVVGDQLLYPDRKVQHAGMFLAGSSLARHAFRFCDAADPGYFGLVAHRRCRPAADETCYSATLSAPRSASRWCIKPVS